MASEDTIPDVLLMDHIRRAANTTDNGLDASQNE